MALPPEPLLPEDPDEDQTAPAPLHSTVAEVPSSPDASPTPQDSSRDDETSSYISDPGSFLDVVMESFEDVTPPSSPDILHVCADCGMYISTLYFSFFVLHDTKNPTFFLCFAEAEFTDSDLLEDHEHKIHQYQCRCCCQWFKGLDDIIIHLASQHGIFYNLVPNISFPPIAVSRLEHILNA